LLSPATSVPDHDIFVWIRIRIHESVPLTNGSDLDSDPDSDLAPVIFVIDLQDANKKLIKKKRYIYIVFQRQKVQKKYITVGIKVFLNIFAC
jgi:hypothetical protein